MPALYIVLQQEIAGFNSLVDNHALSRHSHQLETLATEGGVKPLMSFFSVNAEEAAGLLGENEDTRLDVQVPEEQWFSAQEGLTTVNTLLQALAVDQSAEGAILTRALGEFQKVLEGARSHNIRWHLAIDY